MKKEEFINYANSFQATARLGLESITSLMSLLDNPQDNLKFIHVAGTNGKGSVASIVSEVLVSKGYKVGLFMSPFIIDFRERIKLNGSMISKTDLSNYCTKLKKVVESHNLTIGEFEFITALAFMYYKAESVDFCVLEVGLGGRYDATNTAFSIISVITKISLDHTNLLGNTIKEIAYEKAGIIKENVPIITCNQSTDAINVISNEAKLHNAPLTIANVTDAENVNLSNKTTFAYNNVTYSINLLGEHQVENTIIAICVLNELLGDFVNGQHYEFPNITHPARLEVVKSTPLTILDGAHNPDGANALANYLKNIGFNGKIIFGAMHDKNVDEVLQILSSVSSHIILVTVLNMPRAMSAQNLKEIANKYFTNCVIANSYNEAINLCANEPFLVCGSLYLASGIRPLLLQNNI